MICTLLFGCDIKIHSVGCTVLNKRFPVLFEKLSNLYHFFNIVVNVITCSTFFKISLRKRIIWNFGYFIRRYANNRRQTSSYWSSVEALILKLFITVFCFRRDFTLFILWRGFGAWTENRAIFVCFGHFFLVHHFPSW